ncbi:hypothetical protein AGMMS50212_11570 [Spirochaetia bacterium]|nr:hypothetical protein AGMMS50212_11570 [Spirochaetia bacterium]
MEKELVSLLNDYVFKLVFGDQKNIKNLESLLKTILDLPHEEYAGLKIVDPFLKRLWKNDKMGILDVKVLTKSEKVINVELQVEFLSVMRKRVVYYLAKLIAEQIKSGFDYDKIQETICIVICNHSLGFASPDYLNTWTMNNKKDGEQFTDLMKIVTIELSKVPEEDDGKAVWPFLQCFKCKRKEDFDMLAKKHPEVKEITTQVKKLSFFERHRMIAETKAIWKVDRRHYMTEAHERGLSEGIEKGKVECDQLRLENQKKEQEIERLREEITLLRNSRK